MQEFTQKTLFFLVFLRELMLRRAEMRVITSERMKE